MKHVRQDSALFAISDKDWIKFCKAKAAGEEPDLPGKLLEYSIENITEWDREDYAKEIGIEVPNDLPTERPTTKRTNKKRKHNLSKAKGRRT